MNAGDVIDGFTLREVAHRGGMAILCAAAHREHDVPILVKLPRLTGPYVPRCLGVGHDPLPWFAMERIQGQSMLPLVDALSRPIKEMVEMGGAIAWALCALHRQGVVNLDMKPSNLTPVDGRIILFDFGLSRHAQLLDLMEEEFRLPYGTVPSMVPEQVMGIRGNPASDLFALAALMYFFASGRRPFADLQRPARTASAVMGPAAAVRAAPQLPRLAAGGDPVQRRSGTRKAPPHWHFHPDHQPKFRRNVIAMSKDSAPLYLPEERLTHHVLAAMNLAAALLHHAMQNSVDHIILRACTESLGRRVLGSVSSEVVRDAPCSVTVVRTRA